MMSSKLQVDVIASPCCSMTSGFYTRCTCSLKSNAMSNTVSVVPLARRTVDFRLRPTLCMLGQKAQIRVGALVSPSSRRA
jgi:hypothetical protein